LQTLGCFFENSGVLRDRFVDAAGRSAKIAQHAIPDRIGGNSRTARRRYFFGLRFLLLREIKARRQRGPNCAKSSYADYLAEYGKPIPHVAILQTHPADLIGACIDAVSALSSFENPGDYGAMTYPGFAGPAQLRCSIARTHSGSAEDGKELSIRIL
jgi:hypothetical protein